jgi:hypothetical protein
MPHLVVSDAKAGEAGGVVRLASWRGKALAVASVRRDHEQIVKLP